MNQSHQNLPWPATLIEVRSQRESFETRWKLQTSPGRGPRWWRSNWWKDVPPSKKKNGKAEKHVKNYCARNSTFILSGLLYHHIWLPVIPHSSNFRFLRSPKRALPWVLWSHIRASTRGPPGPFCFWTNVTHNEIDFGTKSPTDHPGFGSPGPCASIKM